MRVRPAFLIRGEPLEQREMLSATSFELNHVGYFVNPSAPRIERYDISAETWLAPITLDSAPSVPDVALVDGDGIYAAFGKTAYRFNLDGSGRTFLFTALNNILAIHSDGDVLFLNYSSGLYGRITSINKPTNTVITSVENYIDSYGGSSISTETNRIIGRSQGVSPSDITYISYTDGGTFSGGGDSPYHGAYPDATYTWMFPGGMKVVDDSGTIYKTQDLTRVASFGTKVTDVGFGSNNLPIVLSGNTLTTYSSSTLPTGSAVLNYSPSKIFVNDHDVVTFTTDTSSATGYVARALSFTAITAPTPAAPVDPNGLAYTPDKVEVAGNGILLLLSKANKSIFRWDPTTQQYGATIPLVGTPDYMAYSSTTNTVYLAYPGGLIRKLDLNAAVPAETPFATLSSSARGLSTAGPYVFAVDDAGAWVSHYTFAPNGTQISAVEWNYVSTEYVWSDANQKMYFFRDDTSPNDLLWEEINANGTTYPGVVAGGIRSEIDSPLHDSAGFTHPIRVSPDGTIVVLGSGVIHNAVTLARQTSALANTIADAAWLGNELYTVRTASGGMQFQHWTQVTYAMDKSAQVIGNAIALKAVAPNRLVGISKSSGGLPIFTVMDENLNEIRLNNPPSQILLQNTVSTLPENTSTAAAIRVADVDIVDDGRGINVLSLGGSDASKFELFGSTLRLKAGTVLDFETKSSFVVSVNVDDPTIGSSVDASTVFTLNLTDVNEPPSKLTLSSGTTTFTLPENTSTTAAVKLADVVITDDGLGTNDLTLGGTDAAYFEVVGTELRLRAGTVLDNETKGTYSFTISVDDSSVGVTPDKTLAVILQVTDINEAPTNLAVQNATTEILENTITSPARKLADIVVTDDALGSNTLSLSGPDAAAFEIVGSALRLKAGTSLDYESKNSYNIVINVDDPTVGGFPDASLPFVLQVTDLNEAPTGVELQNAVASLSEDADTSAPIKLAEIVINDDALGANILSLSGPDAALLQIVGNQLQLRAGVFLSAATNPTIDAVVNVDDAAIGSNPDAFVTISIPVTPDPINDPPLVALVDRISTLAESTDTAQPITVGRIVVIDDSLGDNLLSLGGPDAAAFEIVGNELRLRAGTLLDHASQASYDVTVNIDDASVGSVPDAAVFFTLTIEGPVEPLATWCNVDNPDDIDADGRVGARDALLIINHLLIKGTHALVGARDTNWFLDATNDGVINARDALMVINCLLHENDSATPAAEPLAGGLELEQSAWAAAVDQTMRQDAWATADPFSTTVIKLRRA